MATLPTSDTLILPSLEEELLQHGGAHLYEPSDVVDGRFLPPDVYADRLRLPEDWQEPQPLSLPEDYLGSHLIWWDPKLKWFGRDGYQWEPRLVGYGSYELFGTYFEQKTAQGQRRRSGIGHQLILDFDLALTGTERFHMQFRPLGGKNSGGSFWQLSDPEQYIDNSSGVPQTWWFEGELQSILGAFNQSARYPWDMNITVGKFPFFLHNGLLMFDEIVGVALGKNTYTSTPLSNLNTQVFYSISDVDSMPDPSAVAGVHLTGDFRHAFVEATYAHLFFELSGLDSDYLALSLTQFFGPLTLAGRVMHKGGNAAGTGSGQLYVLESNYTRETGPRVECWTGVELTVSYVNLFKATGGWMPISGGRFDRLQNTFTLNPLLNIAAGREPMNTMGIVAGVQLFRHHQDESIIPEIVAERPDGNSSYGVGLRYLRKLGPRIYLEGRALRTWSSLAAFDRKGLFLSTFVVF